LPPVENPKNPKIGPPYYGSYDVTLSKIFENLHVHIQIFVTFYIILIATGAIS
jgi:hypothetical protein